MTYLRIFGQFVSFNNARRHAHAGARLFYSHRSWMLDHRFLIAIAPSASTLQHFKAPTVSPRLPFDVRRSTFGVCRPLTIH